MQFINIFHSVENNVKAADWFVLTRRNDFTEFLIQSSVKYIDIMHLSI